MTPRWALALAVASGMMAFAGNSVAFAKPSRTRATNPNSHSEETVRSSHNELGPLKYLHGDAIP